eukprot:6175442-Pleurochrysis_carterae.AAC.2
MEDEKGGKGSGRHRPMRQAKTLRWPSEATARSIRLAAFMLPCTCGASSPHRFSAGCSWSNMKKVPPDIPGTAQGKSMSLFLGEVSEGFAVLL